jgi:CheY-like chemotaxis protein
MSTKSVLIVDDDADWVENVLGYGFEEMGYTVRAVSDLRSARKELDTQAYSIVTVDMRLGKDKQIFEGELLLDYIRDHCRHIPCIIISGSLPAPDMIFEMSRRYPMVPDAGYILKSKFSYDMLRDLVDWVCRAGEGTRSPGNAGDRGDEAEVQIADAASGERTQRQRYLVELRRTLGGSQFDEGDLRNLCFDLDDVEYENLPGEGKLDKARELVSYLERRGRISELVAVGKELRPDVDWGDV